MDPKADNENQKESKTYLPRVDQVVEIAASSHESVLNVSPLLADGCVAFLDSLAAGNIRSLFHFLHLVLQRFQFRLFSLINTRVFT